MVVSSQETRTQISFWPWKLTGDSAGDLLHGYLAYLKSSTGVTVSQKQRDIETRTHKPTAVSVRKLGKDGPLPTGLISKREIMASCVLTLSYLLCWKPC